MDKFSDQPKVSKLELESFDSTQQGVTAIELKRLNDVSIELRAELGRCKVPLREVLGWKKDAILTMDKLAGENVDVYVRETRFASGEVLVVEDNFAVRLTELLTYLERVKLGLGRVSD
ncbi:MAG: FliM/FliN family flagellar motor switch protein [Candidatus Glassbacteria bacterium]|nr:FliM/FliN family flagellar motor switch protein [Candidatus Glassbacteria bacterium]